MDAAKQREKREIKNNNNTEPSTKHVRLLFIFCFTFSFLLLFWNLLFKVNLLILHCWYLRLRERSCCLLQWLRHSRPSRTISPSVYSNVYCGNSKNASNEISMENQQHRCYLCMVLNAKVHQFKFVARYIVFSKTKKKT